MQTTTRFVCALSVLVALLSVSGCIIRDRGYRGNGYNNQGYGRGNHGYGRGR